MKQPHTHRVTVASSPALRRDVRRSRTSKTTRSPKPVSFPAEPINHCYRTLLETSSNAILLLSSESIILGWNRAAETVSGWIADEALGRSYVELCLPIETRAFFLAELARVTVGSDVRGLEMSLRARTGSQTILSWNITRVLGTHGDLIGLMAIGTAVVSNTQVEEELRLAHAKLRNGACQVQSAVEEERRRIARELHDEFGQALTGLKFDLAWFGRRLSQSPAPTDSEALLNKVHAMSGSVDALFESVHATAAALRPVMLDDLGLVPALEYLVTTLHSFGLRGMQERAALLGGHVHIAGTSGAGTRGIASVPVGRCVAS